LATWISQTTGRFIVIEAVSTEVAHAASPPSTESSHAFTDIYPPILSIGPIALATPNYPLVFEKKRVSTSSERPP
jgi:hypothetical protein